MSQEIDTSCLQAQFDEVEALESIYGDAWKADERSPGCFAIEIKEKDISVQLYLTLPETYPLESPPGYILSAENLTADQQSHLKVLLDEEYLENVGSGVIYQWIEKIREFIISSAEESEEPVEEELLNTLMENVQVQEEEYEKPEIIHGEVVTDRKSVFQPHLARVYSIEQVKQVLDSLKQQKKIANATHNMYAYRISLSDSTFAQDCDDDGESQAGGRMLHILQIMNVINVIVVVSRWYGGIHLGPDRFRHINNATRQIVQQAGLVSPTQKKT